MKKSAHNGRTFAYSKEQRQKLSDKGGPYFMFREDFLDITTMAGAVVLQKLLNFARWRMKKTEAAGRSFDGWFLYTVKLFRKQLRTKNKRAQLRLLDPLEKQGYIITARRGMPARRCIWIDVDAIDNALEKAGKVVPSFVS